MDESDDYLDYLNMDDLNELLTILTGELEDIDRQLNGDLSLYNFIIYLLNGDLLKASNRWEIVRKKMI